MLDIRWIRSEPDAVKAALELRGPGTSDAVDEVVAQDAEQRRLIARRDEIRGRIKSLSKQVGRLRGQGRRGRGPDGR
jgi:seryl-tRNA synthetase